MKRDKDKIKNKYVQILYMVVAIVTALYVEQQVTDQSALIRILIIFAALSGVTIAFMLIFWKYSLFSFDVHPPKEKDLKDLDSRK